MIVKLKTGSCFHTFDIDKYYGLTRLKRDGTKHSKPWPDKSPFWPLFNKWKDQGGRVNKGGYGIVDYN